MRNILVLVHPMCTIVKFVKFVKNILCEMKPKEIRKLAMETGMIAIDSSIPYYTPTCQLRVAVKVVLIDSATGHEVRELQQMWQGSDGSQKWEAVPEFNLTGV